MPKLACVHCTGFFLHQIKKWLAPFTCETAIVKTIILTAHCLKLKTIASGLETEDQATFFCDLGCERATGYLFGRPLPVNEFSQ